MDTIRVKALDPGVRAMMDDFVKSDVFSEAMPGTVVGIVYKHDNATMLGFLSGHSELNEDKFVVVTADEPDAPATEDRGVIDLADPNSIVNADAGVLYKLEEQDKVALRQTFQDATLRGQLDFRRAAAINVDSVPVPFRGDPTPSSAPPKISYYIDPSGMPMAHVQKSPNDRYYAIGVGRGFTGVARGVHVGTPLVMGVRDGRPAVRFDSRDEAELAWLEMWYRNETRVA